MWDRSHGTLGAICSTRPEQPHGLNLPLVTYTILIGCFSRSFLPICICPFLSTWHLKTEAGLNNTVTTLVVRGLGDRSSSWHSFLPGAGNLPKMGLFLQLQREQHKITNSISETPKPLWSIPSRDEHRRRLIG